MKVIVAILGLLGAAVIVNFFVSVPGMDKQQELRRYVATLGATLDSGPNSKRVSIQFKCGPIRDHVYVISDDPQAALLAKKKALLLARDYNLRFIEITIRNKPTDKP